MRRHSALLLPLLCVFLLFSSFLDTSIATFGDHKPISEKQTNELMNFFSTTYIEKVSSNHACEDCYKVGWMLYHLHHVCTRGGQDGIIVGLEGVNNDWWNTDRFGIVTKDMWCRKFEGKSQ